MTLTNLAALKSRLRIPPQATDQDAILTAFGEAAEEAILDLTGFVVTDDDPIVPVERVDEIQDVQLGRTQTLRYRPVLSLVLDVGSLSAVALARIHSAVRDAYRGKVVALSTEVVPDFPPMASSAPWFRWRQPVWPRARFTYTVDPLGSTTNPVPNALVTACTELAVSMYARAGGGALQSLSVERVSETYTQDSMPPVVQMLIARYVRDVVVSP